MTDLTPHQPRLGRRGLLLGLAAAATLGRARLAFAAPGAAGPGDSRLVVVLLRGAMDGLAVLQPYAEPGWGELRGPLALPEPGREGGLLDLGTRFGLHPRLPKLHAMYRAGQLLPVQAVAGPYRTRSHFDAQDYLDCGVEQKLSSGWLNRALGGLRAARTEQTAFAFGPDLPLLIRGPNPVGMYAPARNGRPEPDLYARLMELNHADPVIGPALAEGMRARGFTGGLLTDEDRGRGGFQALASVAGRVLAARNGPRVAALEVGGWDTHQAQEARLRGVLAGLDDGLDALRTEMGDAWSRTAVLMMTEFGRTVRVNGNAGTDHGTGGAAFLLGGAVAGGRVMGDWPGLNQLFENRDLQPTTDLRAIAKGLLRDHLGLSPAAVAAAFPRSDDVAPATRLLRA